MGNKTAKYIWAVLNFVAVVWLALGGVGGRAFGQTLIGKTVRLNDGTDNVYSVFGEQDIKERVNVKNYADGNTSDSLVWSGVGTDFYLRKIRRGNLITVAKSGGDYGTIQAAVDAATTGTTVLVFPGVFEERVAINKAISLVGTDKNNCVIKHNKDGREDAVVMVRAFMSGFAEIKDLTLWNTGESYSTALSVESPARISNCVMIGNHADTVILKCLYSKHSIYVDNCYITGYYDSLTFASNAGHAWASNCIIVSEGCSPVWVGTKDCNAHINDCDLIVQGEVGGAGGINIGDDVGKSINMFLSNIRCYKPARTAIPLFRIYNGTGTTAYVSNCEYSEIGNSNVSIVYTKTSAINADGNSVFGGSINAGSLKIGGTEVISSARALSNVSIGGGLIDSGTVADARLSSNVPLKNGANTFTNFQTISANATSDMLTVSGGNMSDGKSALRVSGAFPNSAGAYNSMADFKATSGGSDKNEYALNSELLAGGTSAVISAAGRFINARSGTGGAFGTVSGAVGNLGVYAQSGATTAGYNYGGIFDARGGAVNVGVEGLAITNKASAVNVGVFGNASNTAEGGVQVGGLFGLNRTTPPASSAALICDNGNTGKDVFLAKVNGANKVKIDLNGNVELEDSINVKGGINVKGEIKQNGVVAIRMDGCRYFTMPDANKKANGDIISLNDFTHNFGELVYLASDGKAYKADASSTATLPAVAMVADDSAHGYFLLRGYIRNDDWDTLTIGKEVWASTTAGGITQVKPTGAGESVQSVGFAVGAKTIFFDPQRVIITLGGEE